MRSTLELNLEIEKKNPLTRLKNSEVLKDVRSIIFEGSLTASNWMDIIKPVVQKPQSIQTIFPIVGLIGY